MLHIRIFSWRVTLANSTVYNILTPCNPAIQLVPENYYDTENNYSYIQYFSFLPFLSYLCFYKELVMLKECQKRVNYGK